MWTRFMDMNSGGGRKLPQSLIYVEGMPRLASQLFECRLGRDPHHVTCNCCGCDYSVSNYAVATLDEATDYDRDGSLEAHLSSPKVLVLRLFPHPYKEVGRAL